MSTQAPVHVNISTATIAKVLIVILALIFFWSIRQIILIVFMAWVLATAVSPWVDKLQRYRIPRGVGILSVYLFAAALISTLVFLLIEPVTAEVASIGKNLPDYYAPIRSGLESLRATGENIGVLNSLQGALDNLVNGITQATSGIYGAIASVLSGVVALVAILVIAFYLTVEEDGIRKFVQSTAPVQYQPYVIHKLNQIQKRLSSWLWGQLLLMLFVGVITGLVLWALGVKYSLVLGILAGLLEFVPVVGPTLAAVPAIFFAFTDFATAPYKPLLVLVAFVLVQQIENQLLVPRVMKRAVGLNPIIILISLLIGATLGGFVGVVLSIPFVAIVDVFLADFIADKQSEQNRLEQ